MKRESGTGEKKTGARHKRGSLGSNGIEHRSCRDSRGEGIQIYWLKAAISKKKEAGGGSAKFAVAE